MARIFNSCDPHFPMNSPEMRDLKRSAFYCIVRTLPDYAYVGFDIEIYGLIMDAVIIVPHLGVFILKIRSSRTLEIKDGLVCQRMEDGRQVVFRPHQLRRAEPLMIKYFREHFGITPLVYELECYPRIHEDKLMESAMRKGGPLDVDHILWNADFLDRFTLMQKLWRFTEQAKAEKRDKQHFFVDISDEMAREFTEHWNETLNSVYTRPENPPLIFLSYNSNNEERARKVKTYLEQHDFYTWRAPEDVPIGKDYWPYEMEAIEKCTAFVILLSYASQNSEEVRKEFEAAKSAEKPIFPLIIDSLLGNGEEMNDYYKKNLAHCQWRILTDTDQSALEEIVKELEKI